MTFFRLGNFTIDIEAGRTFEPALYKLRHYNLINVYSRNRGNGLANFIQQLGITNNLTPYIGPIYGDANFENGRETSAIWFRRLTKWTLVLLAVIVVVRIADYAWFRAQVPIRFTTANWSGTWKTQQYGLTGRLLVHLPDPLPEDEEFQAEALVYYPIHSGWKTGQFVKMEFAGHFAPESSTSSGITENEISGSRGKLKFKAMAGNQVVDYVAMMDESGDRVIGSYVSKSPNDIGYFFIQNF